MRLLPAARSGLVAEGASLGSALSDGAERWPGVRSIPDARILDADGEPLERFVGYRPAEEVAAILSAARPAAAGQ